MSTFKKLLTLYKPFRKPFGISVAYSIFHVLFNVLSVSLFIPFLTVLFNPEKLVYQIPQSSPASVDFYIGYFNYFLSSLIIERGQIWGLGLVCILNVVLFFFKNVFIALALATLAQVKVGVANNFRRKVYSKYLKLPNSQINENKKGDILSRFSVDVSEIENPLTGAVYDLIKSPVTIIFFLIAMFYIDYFITLIVLFTIPVSGLFISKIGDRLRSTSNRIFDYLGNILARVDETLTGIKTIKRNNSQAFFTQKFEEDLERHRSNFLKYFIRREFASPSNEVLGAFFVSLILFIGGYMVLTPGKSSLQAPEFMTLIVMLANLISPSKSISTSIFNIQKCMSAIQRLDEILDAPEDENENQENKKRITNFQDKVCLNNLWFSYLEGVPVLRGINLEIKKGEKVAIVGNSGSGKTTIFELLYKAIKPQKGTIEIDGIPISQLNTYDLRNILSIVPQETFIISESVENNITFGYGTSSKKTIDEVLKLSKSNEFVETLEEKEKTFLKEGGNNLSGGEKQRIGIARTLYRDSEIILLDEATSALDVESEKVVQESIEQAYKDKTVIAITHRITSIGWVDRIVLIEQGVISEQGTFKELVSKKGKFFDMLQVQQKK